MSNLTLKPFGSAGAIFVLKGQLVLAPVQGFKLDTGEQVIRIGDTILFFDQEGNFDGSEIKLPGSMMPAPGDAQELAEKAHENLGKPPENFYFERDSPGHAAEKRAREELSSPEG